MVYRRTIGVLIHFFDSLPCPQGVIHKQRAEAFNSPWASFIQNHEISKFGHSTTMRSMTPHGLLAHVSGDADSEQECAFLKKRLRLLGCQDVSTIQKLTWAGGGCAWGVNWRLNPVL